MSSTNQSPFYQQAEQKYLNASTDEERLMYLKEMVKECPRHKSSEKMLANLKTRFVKLKKGIEKDKKKRTGKKDGLKKEGDALVSIIGYTNSGKSSLLSLMTKANPIISDLPYTTKAPVQGMLDYGGCKIQIVELPDPDKDESGSFAIARISNLVLVLVTHNEDCEKLLGLLKQNKIKNILIVHNKSDIIFKIPINAEISISCKDNINIEKLKDKIFIKLNLIRIYTKDKFHPVDLPMILKKGSTIKDLSSKIHKSFLQRFNYALFWGPSSKFPGQRVGLSHELKDQDIVEIYLKK
jgi:hypothetical protein